MTVYMMRKLLYIIRLLTVAVLIAGIAVVNVSAEEISNVPYTNYTYWKGYFNKTAVPTKAVYEAVKKLDASNSGVGAFNEVNHLYSDGEFLYIMDSGNGRILKLDRDYRVTEIITSVTYNGENLEFKGAKGLFIKDGELFLADTENKRVLCVKNGEVFKIIEKPESTAIPADYSFAPTRIIRDDNNYLYVLCDGSYYGAMVFDDKYNFVGFFGANNVKTTVFGAIKNMVTSLFETEEKHNASVQMLPYQIKDMCIDSSGFICAVNGEEVGQIRRLGTDGSNILKVTENYSSLSADSFNFGDYPNYYTDTTSKYGNQVMQSFSAIACNDEFIYCVDSTFGKIFIYDQKGQLISVFGGGMSNGNQIGTFTSPNTLAVFGNDLVVSDFAANTITVFKRTDYGETLMKADTLTNKGEFAAAKPLWETVNAQDKNCQLAYSGLANAYLEAGDYKNALSFARQGFDRVAYADAFKYVRNDFLSKNFLLIAIITVLLIGGAITFLIISRKKDIRIIKNDKWRTALTFMFHPLESLRLIREKETASPLAATVLLLVFYVAGVVCNLNSGFMYGIVNKDSYNSLFILIGSVGVVLIWVVMNWIVCMLAEGKATFKEVYCTACYSLMPKTVYYLLFTVLSYIVIPSSNNGFGVLSSICTIYMMILLLVSMMNVQEYTFSKALGMAIVSVIGMAIGAFVIFVVLTLGQDLIGFVVGIIKEIILR